MPVFQYVARDTRGQLMKGQLDAQNPTAVAKLLRDQGLIPTTIEAGTATRGQNKAAQGRGGRVKLDDLVILTRQFATMIRAGLPLIEILNILAEQTEKRALKVIMKQVERDV